MTAQRCPGGVSETRRDFFRNALATVSFLWYKYMASFIAGVVQW